MLYGSAVINMKTRTKILIVLLFVVLYTALIIVVMRAENKDGEIPDEYKGLFGVRRKYSVEVDYDKVINEYRYLFDTTNKDLTIDLKQFKQGEEYLFDDMFWNITLEQVENIVPYSLIEDPSRIHLPEGYAYYVSEDKHELYDQTAAATYEFYEDQLKMVQLTFSPKEKDAQKFFDNIIETLTEIYGQESERVVNDTNVSVGYRWNGENTMLQVDRIDSRVILSVGLAEVH